MKEKTVKKRSTRQKKVKVVKPSVLVFYKDEKQKKREFFSNPDFEFTFVKGESEIPVNTLYDSVIVADYGDDEYAWNKFDRAIADRYLK